MVKLIWQDFRTFEFRILKKKKIEEFFAPIAKKLDQFIFTSLPLGDWHTRACLILYVHVSRTESLEPLLLLFHSILYWIHIHYTFLTARFWLFTLVVVVLKNISNFLHFIPTLKRFNKQLTSQITKLIRNMVICGSLKKKCSNIFTSPNICM